MVFAHRIFSLAILGVACTLSACGPELGPCDMNALGGSAAGVLAPHTGQDIVGSTCAGGRCHSQAATGDLRFGAPAGLDFDVLMNADTDQDRARVTRAGAITADWGEEMWEAILNGSMPPPTPAGPGELNAADKESVRNWLACGAEAIAALPVATSPTWEAIWPAMASQCVACHGPTSSAAGLGFVLGDANDACGSYMHLVGVNATTGTCAGRPLVVPGMPTESLLLDKLSNNAPACGAYMPATGMGPLAATNPALVTLIEEWIVAGALPPPCP